MTLVPTLLGPLHIDDQGGGDRPVAVLWPSLFTDHHMWERQVAALTAAGWRTLAIDPPGHGASPGPGRAFTMDECAEALLQALDALGVQTPVVLIGVSWGGIVAPRVALRAPGRVRGLILFNTTAERPTFFSRMSGALLAALIAVKALDAIVDRMIMSLQLAPATRRRRPRLGASLAARFRSWNRNAVITAVRSVLVTRDGVLDALAAMTAPALIVSGARDTILPSVFSRRMAERMPNARHVEAPGAAHLVPVEAAEWAEEMVLEFLEGRSGAID